MMMKKRKKPVQSQLEKAFYDCVETDDMTLFHKELVAAVTASVVIVGVAAVIVALITLLAL
jgi:hypothetical protein